MATVLKRLCLPVGSYTKDGASQPTTEYREIGVLMEFEGRDGTRWQEVRLHLDILNPALFQLARGQCEKTASSARVRLFDAQAKSGGKSAPEASAEPEDAGDVPY